MRIPPVVGLIACVITGNVRIAFYFDLCQTILQQIDIFHHEFLKYWLLIKVGPGIVRDIDNVCHRNVTLFLCLFPQQQRIPKRNAIFT
jgi:hypothetical protein